MTSEGEMKVEVGSVDTTMLYLRNNRDTVRRLLAAVVHTLLEKRPPSESVLRTMREAAEEWTAEDAEAQRPESWVEGEAAPAHACRHKESPPEAKVEVKSWRMDTVQGLKKEDLVKLSGSAEGKEQLRQLKEELDKCVEWCDRHPEHDDTDVVAAEPSAASADGGGAE
eukprot:Hpha_TRINITY_DN16710_c5_g1::TRINITY_DN16710_c5_g1_i10::g.77987::m.77987